METSFSVKGLYPSSYNPEFAEICVDDVSYLLSLNQDLPDFIYHSEIDPQRLLFIPQEKSSTHLSAADHYAITQKVNKLPPNSYCQIILTINHHHRDEQSAGQEKHRLLHQRDTVIILFINDTHNNLTSCLIEQNCCYSELLLFESLYQHILRDKQCHSLGTVHELCRTDFILSITHTMIMIDKIYDHAGADGFIAHLRSYASAYAQIVQQQDYSALKEGAPELTTAAYHFYIPISMLISMHWIYALKYAHFFSSPQLIKKTAALFNADPYPAQEASPEPGLEVLIEALLADHSDRDSSPNNQQGLGDRQSNDAAQLSAESDGAWSGAPLLLSQTSGSLTPSKASVELLEPISGNKVILR